MENRTLTVLKTAEILGVSRATVFKLISQPNGIPVVRLSKRCIRVRADDLDRWLAERARASSPAEVQPERRAI
jgi:excisionase family DNA binding protein